MGNEATKGRGLWKFNSSLLHDQNYVSDLKTVMYRTTECHCIHTDKTGSMVIDAAVLWSKNKQTNKQIVRTKIWNIALDKELLAFFRKSSTFIVSIWFFGTESISAVCQAVNRTIFLQIVKFKMAVIGHLQFIFLVIFIYNLFVWGPWNIEIYLRCIALMVWDITTINRIWYVIERSWVRAPPGVCYFPRHKKSTVSRTFVR